VQGEKFCSQALSKYIAMMTAKNLLKLKHTVKNYSNMSLRKMHSQMLNKALLPASVLQRSLGHIQGKNSNANFLHYQDVNDQEILSKVASTIEGQLKRTGNVHFPQLDASPGSKIARTSPQPLPQLEGDSSNQFTVITIITENGKSKNTFKFNHPPGTIVKIVIAGNSMEFTI
jgi:hypothetical protein